MAVIICPSWELSLMLPRCCPVSSDWCYSYCFLSCNGARIKKDLPSKMLVRLKSITGKLPLAIPLSVMGGFLQCDPTTSSAPRISSQFSFWILGSHNLSLLNTYILLDHFQGLTQDEESATCALLYHVRNWKANFNIIVIRGYWKRKPSELVCEKNPKLQCQNQ